MIYEFTTSMTITAGSISQAILKCRGGLARQFVVRANTSTTVFRASLSDSNGDVRRSYDFHQGELVDDTIQLPVQGAWTISITNVSPNDTLKIILGIEEGR